MHHRESGEVEAKLTAPLLAELTIGDGDHQLLGTEATILSSH